MCKTRHQDAALSVLLLRLHLFFHCAHSAGVLTGAKIRLFVHKPTKNIQKVHFTPYFTLSPPQKCEMWNTLQPPQRTQTV